MKYLFAGGGTGGHIFPAIAIADEIKIRDKNAEILFIGAKGRIEEKIVPDNNYKLVTIDIAGIDRKNIFKNISLPLKIIRALNSCREIINEYRPDAVIGTGGFVCGPAVYVAHKSGIPTLIQEGNSFAGRTVKYLSGISDKVVINFDETEKYLKRKNNIVRISHPIRSNLKRIERKKSLEMFGLTDDKKTLFIFGGSQGASGINTGIEKIFDKLTECNLNIIWQTGEKDFSRLKNKYESLKSRVRITEFIDNMEAAYSASDLIICRAGITSIMEIAYFGIPAIFIPLPSSAENHQQMNAESIVARKAGYMILQDEILIKLPQLIQELISDANILSDTAGNLKEIADPRAAGKIADEVMKLIH